MNGINGPVWTLKKWYVDTEVHFANISYLKMCLNKVSGFRQPEKQQEKGLCERDIWIHTFRV